ncbi:hypothetical protein D3C73_1344410 [compost metagenome]
MDCASTTAAFAAFAVVCAAVAASYADLTAFDVAAIVSLLLLVALDSCTIPFCAVLASSIVIPSSASSSSCFVTYTSDSSILAVMLAAEPTKTLKFKLFSIVPSPFGAM